LILDRRNGVDRGIFFPMRRTPGKGGGVPHSMQQPWCSRGAGVFSRRSLKLATFHLVFSNLWRWRSAVINAASSSTVIATRCSLMRPRTQQIRYMTGSTYRPLAIC